MNARPIFLFALIIVIGCGPLRPWIVIDFDAAAGLHGGEAVLLGGQRIGESGKPRVQNGVVEVPVLLDDRRAVPRDTVFLIDTDPEGRIVIVAFPRGPSLEMQRGSPPPHFRGAATRAGVAALLTGDELRTFRRWLSDVFDSAIRSTGK